MASRLPVTDFCAFSAGGVFDEIGISISLVSGECPTYASPSDLLTSCKEFRDCKTVFLPMMLPHPQAVRGVVQHRPSHRSNYQIPLTKESSLTSFPHLDLHFIVVLFAVTSVSI